MTYHIHYYPCSDPSGGMPLGALLVFGLALALVGCASITVSGSGAAGTTTPGTGTSGTQGTLAGDVVAGPTCPVERAEDPCPPKAVPNREVEILGANNAVVATAMTDSKGHFSVALAPGSYTVSVPIQQGQIGMRQDERRQSERHHWAGHDSQDQLDTGIR